MVRWKIWHESCGLRQQRWKVTVLVSSTLYSTLYVNVSVAAGVEKS